MDETTLPTQLDEAFSFERLMTGEPTMIRRARYWAQHGYPEVGQRLQAVQAAERVASDKGGKPRHPQAAQQIARRFMNRAG